MRRAALGWAVLGAYVVACDAHLLRSGHPSLSACYRQAPRLATAATATVLLAHLYGVLPTRFDPLQFIASLIVNPPDTEVPRKWARSSTRSGPYRPTEADAPA